MDFRRRTSHVLLAAGLGLLLAGVASAVTGGFVLQLGPLVLSGRDPARLLMEGCVALVLCCVARDTASTWRAKAGITLVFSAFLVALVAESSPRRVGDGAEYVAMARLLSQGRPPSVTTSEAAELSAAVAARSGIAGLADVRGEVAAADGRREFVHFWLYPLLVSPFLRLADALGASWNHAFSCVNVLLLAGFMCAMLRRATPAVAFALAAGPIVWWVDKAHVEVFTFALLGTSVLLAIEGADLALVFLGVLAAQNPVFGLVLIPAAGLALLQSRNRRRTALFVLTGLAVAAVHPLYYVWRLGRMTPLTSASAWGLPSLTAVVTPFVDPMAGIFWYSPWLLAALAVRVRTTGDRRVRGGRIMIVGALVGLAIVFALSGNVNHGGTPGPSRYGVWVLPFALAWLVGENPASRVRMAVLLLASAASVVHSAWAFHPRLAEDPSHTSPLARRILASAPWAYNPLPEVLVDRVETVDGPLELPVATPGCTKVLLVGDGQPHGLWPLPCLPQDLPAWCIPSGALCYANRSREGGRYEFVEPPKQLGLAVAPVSSVPSWRTTEDFASLPIRPRWEHLRKTDPLSPGSTFRAAQNVTRIRAYEGPGEVLAFVESRDGQKPKVLLRLAPGAFGLYWLRRSDLSVLSTEDVSGESWTEAPTADSTVLLVMERRQR